MKRRLAAGFSFVLVLLLFAVPAFAAEVTFYYGKSVGLAEIAAVVKEGKKHKTALWLDAGDLIHGMPRINITKGEAMVPILNEAGMDVTVPGNHDFNYGFAQLHKISKEFKRLSKTKNASKKVMQYF